MTVTQEEDLRRSSRMSLTYSDFPYYLSNEMDPMEHQGITGALPREFQVIEESPVPLIQNADDTYQDFIILAEFSELEGPIPLCTIPATAPQKTDIALNNFAVHLMSTDYQVNVVGHFKICEDTQVLRKNVFKDVHVFMQYFTLYDIKARGFVRPFCFGYVSKDHVKLDKKLDLLISEFDKMTKVLKYANRKWFACELEQYLDKLSKAKESFIQDLVPHNEENVFFFDSHSEDFQNDVDAVTLDQIAHQFSEIENIVRTVKAAENSDFGSKLDELSLILTDYQESEIVGMLQKLQIGYLPNSRQQSIDSLNVPLVHPLKVKGETLRPLTTLGQLGTLHLIWRLLLVYKSLHHDLIYSELTELSNDFFRHCGKFLEPPGTNGFESSTSTLREGSTDKILTSSNSASIGSIIEQAGASSSAQCLQEPVTISHTNLRSLSTDSRLIFDSEVNLAFEMIHASCPMPTDNKSGSYHTVSEEESDVAIPSPGRNESGNDSNGYTSAPGSVESTKILANIGISSIISKSSPKDKETQNNGNADESYRHSVSSFSSTSEDGISCSLFSTSSNSISSQDSAEEIIQKASWWDYAGQKLLRGKPGYGILSFFRHYNKIAHHILYSLLIGRPIIVCGNEEQRVKVSRIMTSLIPFVLCNNAKTWKLLRWHRGILVTSHLKDYKLIGLCIPERLEVHDLIHPRDQNYVTILNVPKKSILGPAYSGLFLSPFENLVQRHFYNSDLSMLTYIGGIYTEIETKIYMYKSLEERNGPTSNKKINFKEIGLKASDIDIIKYLSGLITNADNALSIF